MVFRNNLIEEKQFKHLFLIVFVNLKNIDNKFDALIKNNDIIVVYDNNQGNTIMSNENISTYKLKEFK